MSGSEDIREEDEIIKKGVPIFLGVLEIFLGGVALLITAIFGGTMTAARYGGIGMGIREGFMVMLIYLFGAAFCIVMGIGTIKLRSWARNLMLIFSWAGVAVGIVSFIFTLIIVPKLVGITPGMAGIMGSAAVALIRIVSGLMIFTAFILIPGLIALLYSLKSVKRTFRLADPAENVTDRVPLPVLAVTIFMWLSTLSCLIGTLTGMRFPLFGTILPGPASRAVWFVFAALSFYLGFISYQRNKWGWAGALAFTLFFTVSTAVTVSQLGITRMGTMLYGGAFDYGFYDLSGLDRSITRLMLVSAALYTGFFLFVSRYFFTFGEHLRDRE